MKQKGSYQMKQANNYVVRMVLLACVIAVGLTAIYSAGATYIDSQIGRFFEGDSVGQDTRWNAPGNPEYAVQDRVGSSGWKPACPLPQGWRADWSGGKLWITHYNLNGTVADSLPFDSVEDLHGWIETHPDCCDVDVDKLELAALRDTTPAATVESAK